MMYCIGVLSEIKLSPVFYFRSVTTVRVDFEYSLLRWTEYPPDANHGFYVGAAVITARLPRDSLQNATILARYPIQSRLLCGCCRDHGPAAAGQPAERHGTSQVPYPITDSMWVLP